jgi:hypothetical protein
VVRRRTLAFVLAVIAALLGFATPAHAADAILIARLTGAEAIPPGDPDGSGFGVIFVDDDTNQVCAFIVVQGIEPATAAHIHRGVAGQVGGHAVDLIEPNEQGWVFYCTTATETVVQQMTTNPGAFYLNIHNAPYPHGVLRGQLAFA